MLSICGNGSRLCDGISRRELMRIGGLGAFGLALGDVLNRPQSALASASTGSFGRAKSCIVLFLMGGPPQHSTWDPKPDAVADIRGAFAPIATNVPGIQISELLPRIAR